MIFIYEKAILLDIAYLKAFCYIFSFHVEVKPCWPIGLRRRYYQFQVDRPFLPSFDSPLGLQYRLQIAGLWVETLTLFITDLIHDKLNHRTTVPFHFPLFLQRSPFLVLRQIQ